MEALVVLASKQVVASEEAARLAVEVLRLEQRKFDLGAGTLFQLLQREKAVVKDQTDAINAAAELALAKVALLAARNQ